MVLQLDDVTEDETVGNLYPSKSSIAVPVEGQTGNSRIARLGQ